MPRVSRRTSALPSDDDPSDAPACPCRPAAPACLPSGWPGGPVSCAISRARARMRSSQAPRALARLIGRRLEVIRPLDRARVEDLGDVGADARHHPRDDVARVAPAAHCQAPLFSGRVLFQRATPGDQGTTSARARARMCMRARHRQVLAAAMSAMDSTRALRQRSGCERNATLEGCSAVLRVLEISGISGVR